MKAGFDAICMQLLLDLLEDRYDEVAVEASIEGCINVFSDDTELD